MASTLTIFVMRRIPNRWRREERHTSNPYVHLDQPASHGRAGDVEGTHVAANSFPPLPKQQLRWSAGLQEMQELAVGVVTSSAPPPATAVIQKLPWASILETVRNMPLEAASKECVFGAVRFTARTISACRTHDPDDRPVRLGHDAVGIGVVEFLRRIFATPFFSTTMMRPGMRLVGGVPVAESVK